MNGYIICFLTLPVGWHVMVDACTSRLVEPKQRDE